MQSLQHLQYAIEIDTIAFGSQQCRVTFAHSERGRERQGNRYREADRDVDAAKVSADVASMVFNESMKV